MMTSLHSPPRVDLSTRTRRGGAKTRVDPRVAVRPARGTRSRGRRPHSPRQGAREPGASLPTESSARRSSSACRISPPHARAPPCSRIDPSSSRARRRPLGATRSSGRHARFGERRANDASRHARVSPTVDGLGYPTRSPRRQVGRRRAPAARWRRDHPDAVSSLVLPHPQIRSSPCTPSSAATPMDGAPADATTEASALDDSARPREGSSALASRGYFPDARRLGRPRMTTI